jgi:uncharacterized protein
MDVPAPEVTELTAPYWEALEAGRLQFQRCEACAHAWLPPREECPVCLGPDWAWQEATGTGRLISWVIYHHAFHESLRDRVPYNVAIVALDEGPRLITNIVGPEDGLAIDHPVTLELGTEGQTSVARFRLS